MGIHKPGVAMKHSHLLLLSLYLFLPSVFSLACDPICPPGILRPNTVEYCRVCKVVVTADCKSKEIFGRCGCPMCAKAEGEKCGGLYNHLGRCASFLTCDFQIPKGRLVEKRFARGVCVKKKVKEVKEVKKSFWQKMMDYFSRVLRLFG